MKLIQHILVTWAERHGCRGVTEAAKKAGFPKSTFNYWWNGHNVPKILSQRRRLFELTGHPAFQGGLTTDNKKQLLSEYVADVDLEIARNRLVHLMQASVPDLCRIVLHGSQEDRDKVRSALSANELVRFSTFARALSSEDAFKLLKKELELMKGGR